MGDIALVAAKVAPVFPEKAEIYDGIAGVTITAGQILYRITASGLLGLADEDASAEASQAVGVALSGGYAGQAISWLKRGACYGFTVSALAHNLPVSLSNTAGALLDTGATTNVVGRIEPLSDNGLTKVIYFDFPIGTYATVAT
jgi:hypothetical protein